MGSSKLTKQRRKVREAAEAERRATRKRIISRSKAKALGISDTKRKNLTSSEISKLSSDKTGRVGERTQEIRKDETTKTPLPAKTREPVKKAPIDLTAMNVGEVKKPGEPKGTIDVGGPKRTKVDIVKDLALGNWMEKNPITGKVNLDKEGKPIKVLAGDLPIGIGPGTAAKAGKAAVKASKGSKTIRGLAKAEKADGTFANLDKHIDVDAVAKQLGWSKDEANNVVIAISKSRKNTQARLLLENPGMPLNKIGQLPINSKTTAQATGILGKVFSNKAMAAFGTWAGSVFLGRWGWAESAEAVTIPSLKLLAKAETEEDIAYIMEQLEAADEITNPSTWEEIIMWSPFSAIKGTTDKAKMVNRGVQLTKKIAEQAGEEINRIEEQGESDFAKESRENQEAMRERTLGYRKEDKEYYDDQRKESEKREDKKREEEKEYYDKIAEDRKIAKQEEREADDAYFTRIREENDARNEAERAANEEYFRKIREENADRDAAERAAQEAYWAAIKETNALGDWNEGKSNLKFGLF